jgi:hypothetical protein
MRNLIAAYQSRHPRARTPVTGRPYVPLPHTPAPEPYVVPPLAAMVRPYVLAAAEEQERQRAERSRRGLVALLEIARPLLAAA